MVDIQRVLGGGGKDQGWGLVDHCRGQKTTTKWWWWADVQLQQGVHLPCNLLWGDGGPHRKMVKMQAMWDYGEELGGFEEEQVSINQNKHKILNNCLNFCKNLKCAYLTFE